MKRTLSYLELIQKGILIGSLLFGLITCQKKEDPKPTSSVTISPILRWKSFFKNSIFQSQDNEVFSEKFRFFEGDSVRYNIKINSSNDVKSITIYKVNLLTYTKSIIPGYPKNQFSISNSIEENMTYVIPKDSSTGRYKLMIEVSESNGASSTYDIVTVNGLSKLNSILNQTIYEYHDWSNGQQFLNVGKNIGVIYSLSADSVVVSSNSQIVQQSNTMLFPYIQCDINGICVPGASTAMYWYKQTPLDNMAILKIVDTTNVSFESVLKANQLKDLFENNSNVSSSYFKNFEKGLLIGKYIYGGNYYYYGTANERPNIYYLIKVKKNVAGDILVFDFKYHSAFKF